MDILPGNESSIHYPKQEEMRRAIEEAAAALERALHGDWQQIMRESEIAERIVVKQRDLLIAALRQGKGAPPDFTPADQFMWQAALYRMNAALSLITGIEYPSSGVRRSVIQQAHDMLADFLTAISG